MINITIDQARRFILLRHGLWDKHIYEGKAGALDFIKSCGCIQFDPVDACGKNAELTLFSRVRGAKKQILYDLLYKDRLLLDYPDKQLAIIPTDDFPCFERYRRLSERGYEEFEGLRELCDKAKEYIDKNGPVSSDTLPLEGTIFWHSFIHWSGNWHKESNAARSVLEQMYASGELIIHHKEGTRKFYDIAKKHIAKDILLAPDPIKDDYEHKKWRVERRIGAVGLLWNRPSDAWLNIPELDNETRKRIFEELQAKGRIIPVSVEGIRGEMYIRQRDINLLEKAMSSEVFKPRCEFIAPLDPMMWDRKLIKAIFGFEYSWEIYTPAEKRKYGYYVLPVVFGERFIGRIEAVADRKTDTLVVKNFWYEEDVRRTKRLSGAIMSTVKRLQRFNGSKEISMECEI